LQQKIHAESKPGLARRSHVKNNLEGNKSMRFGYGIGEAKTDTQGGLPMAPCKAILKARTCLCKGTTAFYFERPHSFEFKAGQFTNLTLLNTVATDLEGSTRSLSIASAPHDTDLMVAMRNRDTAFKRAIHELPIGSPMLFQGPFGNFTLHRDTVRPAVFLAGGIGITPFRSMLRQATTMQSPHRIFLFYANRRPEEAAFLEELRNLKQCNPRYTLITTITRPSDCTPNGDSESGHFTAKMLKKWMPDLRTPIFYLAGPTGGVTSMRLTLNAAGVSDDEIRTEEFAGY
jgi:ferredoxin-NADP reductase